MHTDHEPIDPDVLSEMGYEKRDINIRSIKRWTVGFFVLTGLFGLISYGFFRWLARVPIAREESGKEQVTRRIPAYPNPVLQDNIGAKVDIMTMRQAELAILNNYAWADKDRTTVRIPIDRAMDLIASRGAEVVSGANPTSMIRPNGPTQNAQAPRNQYGSAPADKAPGQASSGDTAPRTDIPSTQIAPKSPGASTNDKTGTTPDGRTKVAPIPTGPTRAPGQNRKPGLTEAPKTPRGKGDPTPGGQNGASENRGGPGTAKQTSQGSSGGSSGSGGTSN